ncbi:hypothetical protein [Riemerella anatipestifer]|uniref:hypothetical protein n=1 Tax=Riemerella anatipestifer TaxID=34085 RepID=UPI00069995BC|nr:hypothetical protein [Riemerella anatipestifer]
MKIVYRKIPNFQKEILFHPIRDKIDYIKVLLKSIEILLLEDYDKDTEAFMKLIVQKMNRLFFYSECKYFSISFPFNVSLNSNNQIYEINTYMGKTLTLEVISAIFAILNNNEYKINKSLIYLDIDYIEIKGVEILEELLLIEPCYVRYDYDKKNENGKLHPLHHLDINYSKYGTFKLGLSKPFCDKNFEDFHNIETDCFFIN